MSLTISGHAKEDRIVELLNTDYISLLKEGKEVLFCIDYLDHETHGNRPFSLLEERLRYDLLIFSSDTLCMSVPACIKLRDTTDLLIQLDEFWKNRKIRLQLDVKKHHKKVANYFKNRKAILEGSIPEEQLLNHFEYKAYTDKRTDNFFSIYLPQMAFAEPKDLFINKSNDTDALFRNKTIKLFENHSEFFRCSLQQSNDKVTFDGMVNRVRALAIDTHNLFQRSIVEDCISIEYRPSLDEMKFVTTLLDRAFAQANASTNGATPLSFVLNQLTGYWLAKLLKKTYSNLHNLICALPWSEVYALSQDKDWRTFIEYVNAFIWIVQDSTRNNLRPTMESCIKKISRYILSLSFWKTVKEEATDAINQKMYEYGLASEAQNLELMFELYTDFYAGKHKVLLDVIKATDMLANRLTEKLSKEKSLSYLLEYGKKQKQKRYEILE